MKPEEIIRAWKDETYRSSLSEAERAKLPENPAGLVDLSDAQLETVAGGKDHPIVDKVKTLTKDNSTICQITKSCSEITKGCTVYYPG
jgi:mersacidin/lichenicidin family type 2 lantibiotic